MYNLQAAVANGKCQDNCHPTDQLGACMLPTQAFIIFILGRAA
jgi:hypothetical protein